jgi:alkylation response protein AidB-like acyl-CoA dehydrogenase
LINRATDQKTAFFLQINHVVSRTLVMGGLAAMGVGMSASIVSAYSHRRHVSDPVTGKPIPIILFPTQITPILTAVAQSHVLHAYGESTRQQFGQTETITQQHFLAAVWKVTAARMAMASMQVLIDCCGAQGLFEINQLTTMLVSTSLSNSLAYSSTNYFRLIFVALRLLKAISKLLRSSLRLMSSLVALKCQIPLTTHHSWLDTNKVSSLNSWVFWLA